MSFFLDTIIIDVAYTSRKLCQKESQHYGSFDQPDLQLLNDCKFFFGGLATKLLGNWKHVIKLWKGLENKFPTVHYTPQKF